MNEFINKLDKKQIKSFSHELSKLSPTEFITIGSIIGIFLSNSITPNEQNTLGNFLEMVGQILLTSYAQSTVTNPRYINFSLLDGQNLQLQINKIIDKLNSFN